jgi:hypothetical protein
MHEQVTQHSMLLEVQLLSETVILCASFKFFVTEKGHIEEFQEGRDKELLVEKSTHRAMNAHGARRRVT